MKRSIGVVLLSALTSLPLVLLSKVPTGFCYAVVLFGILMTLEIIINGDRD